MEKAPQVLVIGDACTDIRIAVDTRRKNPEFPEVPLLKAVSAPSTSKGMAWLVANSLIKLGIKIVLETPPAHNEIKTRYIDNITGKQVCRIDTESPFKNTTGKLSKGQRENLLSGIYSYAFDAIVISDYCKGFISEEDIYLIVNACNRYKVPVFVDTKKKDLSCCSGAIIKINQHEYTSLSDIPSLNTELIVTLGEQGVMHPAYGLKPCFVPKDKYLSDYSIDPCGAGDFFLSGLVYGYLTQKDLNAAINYGIVNAGLRVYGFNWTQSNPKILEEFVKEYNETTRQG